MARRDLRALALALAALAPAACEGCSRRAPARREGPPERVVALAPNLAEIAADIGAAETLVGLSSYGRAPAAASRAERVGGFVDPSIERIIALGPDLVVGVPLQHGALESCRAAGLDVLEVECETMEQALAAYRTLGEALGRRERAEEARGRLEARLDAVRRRVAGLPRPRALFLLGRAGEDFQQVFPVARGNFGSELLEIAGGANVLEAATPSLSAESVIALAPEVVIEVAMDDEAGEDLRELPPSPVWARLGSVPAVRDGRVASLATSALLVPGPRMDEGAELLERLLHPEADRAAP